MNSIESIYTTVVTGRGNDVSKVYINDNNRIYIGNVEVYDDLISRFVAWLFGKSVIVNFDGEVRSISKKGFVQLLEKYHLHDKIQDIRDHCVFKDMIKNTKIPFGQTTITSVIKGSEAYHRLNLGLAKAISERNIQGVKLMINKGADVNEPYCERTWKYRKGDTTKVHHKDVHRTERDENSFFGLNYKVTVFNAPPILHAVRADFKDICELLEKAGAKENAQGVESEYIYDRGRQIGTYRLVDKNAS